MNGIKALALLDERIREHTATARIDALLSGAMGTPNWQAGLTWYRDYGRAVIARGYAYDLLPGQSVATFAILSQMLNVGKNWLYFDRLAVTREPAGLPLLFPAVQAPKLRSALAARDDQAALACATGDKVRIFAACLWGDESEPCIDRHAYHAAHGAPLGKKMISTLDRRIAVTAHTNGARLYGITPAQSQAICWLAIRGGDDQQERIASE